MKIEATPASAPYDRLSEASGTPISDEAASMMVTRYLEAAEISRGRRTLEIACASGPGLGMLSKSASFLVGADINAAMLARAQRHYRGRVPLVRLSAEALPFRDGSFDSIIFLEATYYVPNFDRAIDELDRLLTSAGRLLFVNANPERADFIRSPFSHHYHAAHEFRSVLSARGFRVSVFGAFPIRSPQTSSRVKGRIVTMARRTLEALHLVPRTLEGRARLKRLLGQKLRHVPAEIDAAFAERATLIPLGSGSVRDYKVIFVSAERSARST